MARVLKWVPAGLAFCLAAGAAAIQPSALLWGSLKPGPYGVGYRSTFQFDFSRQYDADYPATPTARPMFKPRPILTDVWYPAGRSAGKAMPYREYLEVSSIDPRIASFAKRLTANMRDVVSEETVGKAPAKASAVEKAAFDRLLATNTFAVKNAIAAKGRFPVVIYHPGVNGTPEDNSALFEYLSSNGYVVISSAYQDADGYDVHCGGGGLECDFRDMEFLVRYAHGLAFADADQLGAMGHSLGAWETFAWVAEPDSAVQAFVSLDSGLEYDTVETSGVEALKYQMKLNKDNIRAASIRFASRERQANFDDIGPYLRFAPQYEATVDGLKHNDYLTHGAIGPSLLPSKWPDATGLRRQSYDQICRHVLYYLDAILKGKSTGRDALARSLRGEGLRPGFTLQYKPPIPAKPTPRQLSQYVRQHGPEKAIALMKQAGGTVESTIPTAHVLLEDGDAKFALSLLALIAKERPNLVSVQALMGRALILTGDRKSALAAFLKAKEIISVDKTDAGFWQSTIDEGLKELGDQASSGRGR